jgi:SDR family mycofactocin-dependent oxidoreductase
MTQRFTGKVAFITGAGRGQGRNHAVRMAEEGADIIAIDICGPVPTVTISPPTTEEDLAETVRLVEKQNRRIVAATVDVRDRNSLQDVVDEGVKQLGRLDVVCANAGIFQPAPSLDVTDDMWRDIIDVNLTGVWNTCRVALPHLISAGGGSIVITSSAGGLKGNPNTIAYTASKHAVVGVMRVLANEFGPEMIRVNSVHPAGVDTPMISNEATWRLFAPNEPNPTKASAAPAFQADNALPIPWLEVDDISNAVLFLASDDARYITGVTLPVDAGYLAK